MCCVVPRVYYSHFGSLAFFFTKLGLSLKRATSQMPFCTHCGTAQAKDARFCMNCGSPQPESDSASAREPTQTRTCPFCKESADVRASKCARCGSFIGRIEECVTCPRCREVVPLLRITATNEKGWGTSAAKIVIGGGLFLDNTTEEYYVGCPVCRYPMAFCQFCRVVTVSMLDRKWVGVGRSRSGYQYYQSCGTCGSQVS
jgi:hypothetical protein